jgi:hypothetical protein
VPPLIAFNVLLFSHRAIEKWGSLDFIQKMRKQSVQQRAQMRLGAFLLA